MQLGQPAEAALLSALLASLLTTVLLPPVNAGVCVARQAGCGAHPAAPAPRDHRHVPPGGLVLLLFGRAELPLGLAQHMCLYPRVAVLAFIPATLHTPSLQQAWRRRPWRWLCACATACWAKHS